MQGTLEDTTGTGSNDRLNMLETVDTAEGLGFRTAEEFLRFIRNQSEEALHRRSPRENHGADAFTDTGDAGAEADAVVLALVDAWNRHDPRSWAACFTEDADYINVAGRHWQGRREIEGQHRELHNSVLRNSRFRPLAWTIRLIAPQVAVVHLNWQMKGTEGHSGWDDRATRRGILTLVIVQQKSNRWLVSAAHNTDMAPFTAPHA